MATASTVVHVGVGIDFTAVAVHSIAACRASRTSVASEASSSVRTGLKLGAAIRVGRALVDVRTGRTVSSEAVLTGAGITTRRVVAVGIRGAAIRSQALIDVCTAIRTSSGSSEAGRAGASRGCTCVICTNRNGACGARIFRSTEILRNAACGRTHVVGTRVEGCVAPTVIHQALVDVRTRWGGSDVVGAGKIGGAPTPTIVGEARILGDTNRRACIVGAGKIGHASTPTVVGEAGVDRRRIAGIGFSRVLSSVSCRGRAVHARVLSSVTGWHGTVQNWSRAVRRSLSSILWASSRVRCDSTVTGLRSRELRPGNSSTIFDFGRFCDRRECGRLWVAATRGSQN